MVKHCWAQTGVLAAICFGVETGLWKQMARNGDKAQQVEALAGELDIDPKLLSRLMRHLGSMGYLEETGIDEYQPTRLSKSLSLDYIAGGYLALPACTGAGPLRFHEYSRARKFKNPTDAKDTSMMFAYGTGKNMFEWLDSLGLVIANKHFNNHMSGYRQGRTPWFKFFPIQERLFNGACTEPGAPLLVDIGGSLGHDLKELYQHYPSPPGKLILQDLGTVFKKISYLDPVITKMAYNFHDEQPIKGARAYYLHSVLHDWPDDVCKGILARIKAAMKPGYSKLLINENVIPSTGVWWETSALDMVMLTLFSSQERTERDWRNLLENIAGFRIVSIWKGGKAVESLIEVELPNT
ncbi:sterigmatocystin 8-o-methyltransferase [Colletotrichum musicola]|uniref:Sterigmatocystin 8-o-methyltransferase n=1 Tax=Colletotrichum musicola TaxID=2175873 RepID=A0A8H6MRP2_9PEZI|nr:sterigmatocystin 8-o-methyltransferase [Colletotrichum musicola]